MLKTRLGLIALGAVFASSAFAGFINPTNLLNSSDNNGVGHTYADGRTGFGDSVQYLLDTDPLTNPTYPTPLYSSWTVGGGTGPSAGFGDQAAGRLFTASAAMKLWAVAGYETQGRLKLFWYDPFQSTPTHNLITWSGGGIGTLDGLATSQVFGLGLDIYTDGTQSTLQDTIWGEAFRNTARFVQSNWWTEGAAVLYKNSKTIVSFEDYGSGSQYEPDFNDFGVLLEDSGPPQSVPEPFTMGLGAVCLGIAVGMRRRRRVF